MLTITNMNGKYTDRQRQLLSAAMAILTEQGLSRLTIRNIATRVGMTEPGLYRHFPHKLALIEALLDVMEESMFVLFQGLNGEIGSLEKILDSFLRGVFLNIVGKPGIAALVFSDGVFHEDPGFRGTLVQFLERNQANLIGRLKHLKTKGLCCGKISVEDAALILMGTLRLFVSRWVLSGYGLEHESELKHLAKMLSKVLV